MAPIRVLIADDSRVAREWIKALIDTQPDMQVIGEASNGCEAVELALRLRPSIVTMDLEMPIMGGMQAIETIMTTQAIPIVVVSGVADAPNACEALRLGALDALCKPGYDDPEVAHLIDRIRLLAGVSVVTRRKSAPSQRTAAAILQPAVSAQNPCRNPQRSLQEDRNTAERAIRLSTAAPMSGNPPGQTEHPLSARNGRARQPHPKPYVFAIAASTGGPEALARLLPQLPADFPCPILIAQHITDGFAAGMAQWLNGLCAVSVTLAETDSLVRPGQVYISPSEMNLVLAADGQRLLLEPPRPSDIYHPCCNRLLESVAVACGQRAVGIIMTGMGKDGAQGIARIAEYGGLTLAQDAASSVIYGMNRVAIESGAVQQVLPAADIPQAMLELATTSGRPPWAQPR